MGSVYDGDHNKWYKICPELPFSFCGNLLATIAFIIFLPALIVLVPFFGIIGALGFYGPYEIVRGRGFFSSCCCKLFTCFLIIFIGLPICLALGMTCAILVGAIAILPLYFLSISFLVRLSIAGCRTKL